MLDVDQAWIDAEVAGDRAALERILDDGFAATFGTGALVDKAHFLQQMIDAWQDPTKAQRLSDRHVTVDGDTAVTIETDTVGGTDAGKAYSYDARVTAVYVRRTGAWKAIALHLVRKRAAN